jgi:hypothetical protein
MVKRIYFVVISLLCFAKSLAQPFDTYLTTFDPNPQFPYGYDNSANIWSINDYIYVTNLFGDGIGNRQAQIFKINANSREIIKQVNLEGPQIDIATSGRGGYCITADKHILLTGEWRDYENARMRTFIAKFDKDLNLIWVNYYQDIFEFHAYGDAVAETPSGDIMLYLTEGIPFLPSEPWISGENLTRILKTNAQGNILFNKIIPDTVSQAVGYGHLSQMEDGNYLLSSQLVGLNYYDEMLGLFRYNTLLHKIDDEGVPIWSRLVNYSLSGLIQEPTSTSLPNGGGAVMWSRDTFGAPSEIKSSFQELNRIDNDGNTLWRHAWLDQSLRYFYRIISAANGDILGVGAYFHNDDEKGKAVIFRASQDGELLWERHYSDSIQRPWSPYMEMFDICELADGRIAATGVVFDTNAVGSLNPNIAVLVVGDDGCLESGCTEVNQYITSIFEPLTQTRQLPQLICAPIPASAFISVKLPIATIVPLSQEPMLRAYNAQGSLLTEIPWRAGIDAVQIDVSGWSLGVYQLLFLADRRPLFSSKIIVQH